MKNDDCGILIKQIHDALEKNANNELRAKDLTLSQIQLLIMLNEAYSGIYPLKELEKLLQLSQATIAGLVKRLEQKGFVESYTDADDKRIKNTRLTVAGENILLEARKQIDAAERRLLKGFSEDEARQFRLYLRKINENLK